MRIFEIARDYFVQHPIDLIPAFILAVFCAVVADFVPPGPRIRTLIRHMKNSLSEGSDASLRQRIADIQRYRDYIAGYMESDKAHYLATLQYINSILLMICLAERY